MRKIYSVTVGMPGYLPNDASYWETLREARDYAQDAKAGFLEDEDIRVRGEVRRDWGYDVLRKNYLGEWELWQRIAIDDVTGTITDEEFLTYEECGGF